ncbi:MAG: IS21-like element helper ATPase IstB [Armatimonadota bacterium]|jgi:DNA replication protein DnaC
MNERDLLLTSYLKRLRMPTVAANYAKMADDAAQGRMDYAQYLLALVEAEICQREANMRRRRLTGARFPQEKTLDSFEFSHLPNLSRETVFQLAGGEYIRKCENVIMLGPTGVGKTHIAIALGTAACGQGKRVRFYTAAGLVNELMEAANTHHLSRLDARLGRFDLIVLDEVGYVPFSEEGARLLFNFISSRYERGPLVITSNLEFGKWTSVFGDEHLTGALLDRLTHHCHILEMNGDSYRFRESLKRKNKS